LKVLEVVIFGNDQFADGLADSLIANRWSRVTRSESYLLDIAFELDMICPDIVIFEIGSDSKIPGTAFFCGYPAIKFIGINAKESVMVIFFDNGQTVVNADDLEWEVRKMVNGRND